MKVSIKRTCLKPAAVMALTLLPVTWGTSPATAAEAPGRVVVSADGGAVIDNVGGGRLGGAVALPDGGAVLAGWDYTGGGYVTELESDGSPDPGFGSGGTARLPGRLEVMQLLRQSDGKLLVLALGEALSKFRLSQLEVIRLDADGSLDPTYGDGGVVVAALEGGCACSNAVLTPQDELLLVGSTGSESPAIEHDPGAQANFNWAVERLTPSGAPDPSFGTDGVATVPLTDANGSLIALLSDGDILAAGQGEGPGEGHTYLTELTPTGSENPDYGSGKPVRTPASATFSMQSSPEGSVTLTDYAHPILVRYTANGTLDTQFGQAGELRVPPGGTLIPGPGEDVTYLSSPQGLTNLNEPPASRTLRVEPITPSGSVDPSHGIATLAIPFGGGGPGLPFGDSFEGTLLQRADGSYLAVGTVGVAEITDSLADGFSAWDFAAAAFTPTLSPDPAFGASPPQFQISLRLPRQRIAADLRRRAIRLSVGASATGVAAVTVRAGGLVLARGVDAIAQTGLQTKFVTLTAAGRRALGHRQRHLHVTVSVRADDLWAETTASAASGELGAASPRRAGHNH